MSGTVDDFWTLYGKSDHLAMAHRIAEDLDEPQHSFKKLVNFLKTVPANMIYEYGAANGFKLRTVKSEWAPIIESEC